MIERVEKNGNHKSTNEFEKNTVTQQNPLLPLKFKVLRAIVYIFVKSISILYFPLFIYRAFQNPKRCPPITDDLLNIPASKLIGKIQDNEISCEKVISSYILRIKEVNPFLNAVIEDRFFEAMEDAKKVDRLVSSEDFLRNREKYLQMYPLLGIPLTLKGSLAVKALQHTSGLMTRKDLVAAKDAAVVEMIRKAGAIPLLTSNLPELCQNWESFNKIIGTTVNPYDSTRTCGGSSGGEACLIAAGASLIGIGSDALGSIRLPANNCGIWGHKPTPTVVPLEGHYPSCARMDKWETVFAVGPMARYAGDLRILLRVMSKPEKLQQLQLDNKIDVKSVKIYYNKMDNFFWKKPSEHCTEAVQRVITHLTTICDTTPEKIDFYLLQYSTDLGSLGMMAVEDVEGIYDNEGNGFFTELLRYLLFMSKYNLFTILFGMFRKINRHIPEKTKKIVENALAELKEDFVKRLGKNGVFILPTFPVEAFKHGDAARNAFSSGFMSIFNALGFPVTNCPVGVTKEGIPIGIQVVGLPYSDNLIITVAEELENAFGGWRAP